MSVSDAAPLPRAGEVFFDVRGSSRCMRLSWYADTGVAVFSIWQGARCTGTFRLPIDDLPRMVQILGNGPAGPPSDLPPGTEHSAAEQSATEHWGAAEPAAFRDPQSQAQVPGYEREQPRSGRPGGPPADRADLPAYPDLPGYPGRPGSADHPGSGYRGLPGPPYSGRTAGYPDRPAAAYRGEILAPGYPAETAPYPDRGAVYPDLGGAGYPGRVGPAYPDQPGEAYPDQPGEAYRGQPGEVYPAHSGPAYPDQADAGYPARRGAGYHDDATDGGLGRPANLSQGQRDNAGAGAARPHAPAAESFPYGLPPDNPEPPRQRRDTRSSLR